MERDKSVEKQIFTYTYDTEKLSFDVKISFSI